MSYSPQQGNAQFERVANVDRRFCSGEATPHCCVTARKPVTQPATRVTFVFPLPVMYISGKYRVKNGENNFSRTKRPELLGSGGGPAFNVRRCTARRVHFREFKMRKTEEIIRVMRRPLPATVRALIFILIVRRLKPLLPSSTRIELRPPTLQGVLSSGFLLLLYSNQLQRPTHERFELQNQL